MKTLLIICLMLLAGCEIPPEHIAGLHNHAHRLDVINYYADGKVVIRDYYLLRKCDTCDIIMGYNVVYKEQELLYGESTYQLFEAPIDFSVMLIPNDPDVYMNTWYIHIDKGNKNKHTELILQLQ